MERPESDDQERQNPPDRGELWKFFVFLLLVPIAAAGVIAWINIKHGLPVNPLTMR